MTPRARPLREPTLWFVLIATAVHVVRQNLVDVLVFLGTALLIVLDALRPWHDRPTPLLRPTRRVAVGVCVAYALLVLPMARTGWPMRVAVAVPGVLALVVVLRTGRALVHGPRRSTGRGWLVWAGLLVAVCLFQVDNFVHQPDPQTDSHAHPTLSALVDPLLASAAPRAVFAGAWLAVGIWLLRQLTRGREEVSQP